MSISLDSKIPFKKLCNFFEAVFKAKGSQKFSNLERFTRECRNFAKKLKAKNPDTDISLYPIFRLILPDLERERGPYGLKTKNLTSLYTKVFCLGKNTDADELKNYKNPINSTSNYDDFAERIYWIMHKRLVDDSSMTISDVNKFLDDVAKCNESNRKKDDLFFYFMGKISAIELKWLTRILLKDVKLGLSKKKAFEAIHPDAQELFNVTSDLKRVCSRFAEPHSADSQDEICVQIFSHVKPMLLERLKIEEIGSLFRDEQQYFVQTKFDGERSQLHMKDGRFKYFTRQGFDITKNSSYGEFSHSGGFLTSNVAQLLNKNCKSIILDGELMGWHKQRRSFGSKGISYDVKKLSQKSQHQPCFVAYDVLLYNDENFVNKPYSERLTFLKSAFTEKEGVLMLCDTTAVTKVDQLLDKFNISVENNDEGIVLKKSDCIYKPNVREKSGCYKIKAEYSDGLVEDLDLIILGGYYGRGRQSGMVNSFLVGVASPPVNKNGLPSEFFAVVAVGSGLNGNELKSLHQRFKHHWKDKKPVGVIGPKSQPPDVWIAPKNSVILQLRATEIIKTQVYPLGYSLRFPRVLKVRDDKSWSDVCFTTEFTSLVKDNGAVQKLTKRKKVMSSDIDEVADEDEVIPKQRKRANAAPLVYNRTDLAKTQDVLPLSRLFENREFCVINGDAQLDKNQITIILREHMANVVNNPGKNTFCVLVGDPNILKAQNIISMGNYDVASLDWLKRATRPENLSKIQEFHPWELFSASYSTQVKMNEMYDEYFDNYVEDTNEDDFKRVLSKLDETLDENSEVPLTEMKKVDKLLFEAEVSPFTVFRGIEGYFHDEEDVQKYRFAFMNGIIALELHANVDYIFVNERISADALEEYTRKATKEDGNSFIPILKTIWIKDCFESGKLVSTDGYVI